MSWVHRLRKLIFGESRPAIEWVTVEGLRARFDTLRPRFAEELRQVAETAAGDRRIRYVLFDLAPGFAFDTFPVTSWTFDTDGREYDSSMHGRRLLQDETLLDPHGAYPLGRADSPIGNTIGDIRLVEDVMLDELRKTWQQVAPGPLGFTALAGVWDADPSPMVDLSTGEARVHEFLSIARNELG